MESSKPPDHCSVCEKDLAICQCATQAAVANPDGNAPEVANHDLVIDERYRILKEIGSGGMGTVYKAEHALLGSNIALKILSAELVRQPHVAMRFQREARACASLSHSNIVTIHDCGIAESGQPYLAMDFINGESLADLIATNEIDIDRFRSIFSQIANAMAYSHQQGVIHRDIKPSNLLLDTDEDGKERCTVVDFGVAKIEREGGEQQRLTQTGQVLGSPHYMSPEQCQGRAVDSRTDIYSLGCVMYETLTGKPPFVGQNALSVLIQHIEDEPAQITSLKDGSAAPVEITTLVHECLRKDPASRPQSMEEVYRSLQAQTRRASNWKPIALLSTVVLIGVSASIMILPRSANEKASTASRPVTRSEQLRNDYLASIRARQDKLKLEIKDLNSANTSKSASQAGKTAKLLHQLAFLEYDQKNIASAIRTMRFSLNTTETQHGPRVASLEKLTLLRKSILAWLYDKSGHVSQASALRSELRGSSPARSQIEAGASPGLQRMLDDTEALLAGGEKKKARRELFEILRKAEVAGADLEVCRVLSLVLGSYPSPPKKTAWEQWLGRATPALERVKRETRGGARTDAFGRAPWCCYHAARMYFLEERYPEALQQLEEAESYLSGTSNQANDELACRVALLKGRIHTAQARFRKAVVELQMAISMAGTMSKRTQSPAHYLILGDGHYHLSSLYWKLRYGQKYHDELVKAIDTISKAPLRKEVKEPLMDQYERRLDLANRRLKKLKSLAR